jgi:hypothetical protein
MVINKHGSFYIREGWISKIIEAINEDPIIFTPSNEQQAVDTIGLGRVMIRALRYWGVALGLFEERKNSKGIEAKPTTLCRLIENNDKYCIKNGTKLLLHRELITNENEATAWYWLFNEWNKATITKEEFVNSFHSYLLVNGMSINKAAVEKEFNCLRNTYILERTVNAKTIVDEDTIPFLMSIKALVINKEKQVEKNCINNKQLDSEILMYAIAKDNYKESKSCGQVSVEKIAEDKGQVGRYFNLKYSELIEGLLVAENKGYIKLINNFGNRYIEFLDMDYENLISVYYEEGGAK